MERTHACQAENGCVARVSGAAKPYGLCGSCGHTWDSCPDAPLVRDADENLLLDMPDGWGAEEAWEAEAPDALATTGLPPGTPAWALHTGAASQFEHSVPFFGQTVMILVTACKACAYENLACVFAGTSTMPVLQMSQLRQPLRPLRLPRLLLLQRRLLRRVWLPEAPRESRGACRGCGPCPCRSSSRGAGCGGACSACGSRGACPGSHTCPCGPSSCGAAHVTPAPAAPAPAAATASAAAPYPASTLHGLQEAEVRSLASMCCFVPIAWRLSRRRSHVT